MATYPAFVGTTSGGATGAGTSHAIASSYGDHPVGSHIFHLISHCNTDEPATTITSPATVTDKSTQTYWVYRTVLCHHVKQSGEASTFTWTTSRSCQVDYTIFALPSSLLETPFADGSAYAGGSTYPDPPNLAPGIGSQAFKWIAVALAAYAESATMPSGYTQHYFDTGTNGFWKPAIGYKNSIASSENPGSFTLDTYRVWIAFTIAASCERVAVTLTKVTNTPTIFTGMMVNQVMTAPDSDVLATGWTTAPTPGGSLYAQVDEETVSDTDYIQGAV